MLTMWNSFLALTLLKLTSLVLVVPLAGMITTLVAMCKTAYLPLLLQLVLWGCYSGGIVWMLLMLLGPEMASRRIGNWVDYDRQSWVFEKLLF